MCRCHNTVCYLIAELDISRFIRSEIGCNRVVDGVGFTGGRLYDRARNVLHPDDLLAVIRIQGDGLEVINYEILLHILMQEDIRPALEEFPEHPDGHGEAEGHHGQIQG